MSKEEEKEEKKEKGQSAVEIEASYYSNLNLEVTPYHFCHIPFIRHKLLNSAHTQKRGIKLHLLMGEFKKL